MIGRVMATALTLLVLAPAAAFAAPRELEPEDQLAVQIVPYVAFAAPTQANARSQPLVLDRKVVEERTSEPTVLGR